MLGKRHARDRSGLILESILRNKRLDGAAFVLADGKKFEELELRPRIPPILQRATLHYPSDTDSRLRDSLTASELEELSLLARLRVTGVSPGGISKSWERRAQRMPTLHASDVLGALHAAAAHFDQVRNIDLDAKPNRDLEKQRLAIGEERHAARRGLQITGCYIKGTIELVNAELPFSVRLIGCAIDGAITADHCRLTTLDLSCSAVHGVYATFLKAAGSVRMRRTFSSGPVDFGGAHISAVFDASDSVTLPASVPPATEAYVGDRGIYNLSLATIENEVRFLRARVYGGLTLKGCTIQRSLFLDEALLRAPIAVVELNAYDEARVKTGFSLAAQAQCEADRVLAEALHSTPGRPTWWNKRELEERVLLETLKGVRLHRLSPMTGASAASKTPHILEKLLGESMRARTSSLRGDGLHIEGSLFARGLRSGGRLRLKYARVGGGVHFDGARLRASRFIASSLHDAVAADPSIKDHSTLLDDTYKEAQNREPQRDDEFALDLREARMGGALSIGGRHEAGRLVDSQLTIDMGRALDDVVHQHLTARVVGAGVTHDPSEQFSSCTLIVGSVALTGAHIAGDLKLDRLVANIFRRPELPASSSGALAQPTTTPAGRQNPPFLRGERLEVGGDFDLRDSVGIDGLDATRARIKGSVQFANEPRSVNGTWDPVRNCARLLAGDVIFAGAKVGGNAVFVFDRDTGANLYLGLAEFDARLSIIPSTRKFEMPKNEYEAFARLPTSDGPVPTVDLRNARAVVFGHPPSAWPYSDHLVIEGFEFDRSRSYGPLPARRRSMEQAETDRGAYWKYCAPLYVIARPRALISEVENRAKYPSRFRQRMSQLAVGTALYAFGGILAWLIANAIWQEYLSPIMQRAAAMFGTVNLLLLALVLLWSIAKQILQNFTWPPERDAKPLAVDWLRLQRSQLNVYRIIQRVWPLEPYGQAARLLRAAGRVQSADWVERERMILRRRTMSWRHHFPARAFLLLADALTKYGFGIARAVTFAVFAIALGACAFHQGDACGLISPASDNVIAGTLSGHAFSWPEPASTSGLPAANVRAPYPRFVSLLYALDVATPVVTLGQEDLWRPGARADLAWSPTAACFLPNTQAVAQTLDLIRIFLSLFGWLLASAIAVALLTRAETILARSEQ